MHARNVPGVTFYSLHPGAIRTNLQRYSSLSTIIMSILPVGKSIPQGTMLLCCGACVRPPWSDVPVCMCGLGSGAATSVYCALSDQAVPGEFHESCNVTYESMHAHFKDMAMAERLLQVSEAIVADKTRAPAA
jgi:hypothetical protein